MRRRRSPRRPSPPWADATVGLRGGSMVVTQSFGGLTKLERAAVEIAAGMCGRLSNHAPISGSVDEFSTPTSPGATGV